MLILYLVAMICLQPLQSHASDTLRVVTHNRVTVVTDPSKGENLYKAWGEFSSPQEDIRSITRTGSPATLP